MVVGSEHDNVSHDQHQLVRAPATNRLHWEKDRISKFAHDKIVSVELLLRLPERHDAVNDKVPGENEAIELIVDVIVVVEALKLVDSALIRRDGLLRSTR